MKDLLGIIMFLSFSACYMPQIWKLYKNQSSKDVSVLQYWLSIVGYTSAMGYMFLTEFGLWWFLNYAFGIIACSMVIYLCYKYK